MKVYGIKNCNTVKKALTWLEEHKIPYAFHDYKKEGISIEKLQEWAEKLGWQNLINKKGTTWRGLSPEQQGVETAQQAFALMQEKTSLIKRPLVEGPKGLLLGFDENEYQTYFK
jgi:arsenate reductase